MDFNQENLLSACFHGNIGAIKKIIKGNSINVNFFFFPIQNTKLFFFWIVNKRLMQSTNQRVLLCIMLVTEEILKLLNIY
jgi:hypothetical protein